MVQSLLDATLTDSSLLQIVVRGRQTGQERRAPVWFAYRIGRVYLLAHREVQWWRNLRADPHVKLELDKRVIEGRARMVPELQESIYAMFRVKYGRRQVEHWYGDAGSNRVPFEIELLG